jgi:hypothetical protein
MDWLQTTFLITKSKNHIRPPLQLHKKALQKVHHRQMFLMTHWWKIHALYARLKVFLKAFNGCWILPQLHVSELDIYKRAISASAW